MKKQLVERPITQTTIGSFILTATIFYLYINRLKIDWETGVHPETHNWTVSETIRVSNAYIFVVLLLISAYLISTGFYSKTKQNMFLVGFVSIAILRIRETPTEIDIMNMPFQELVIKTLRHVFWTVLGIGLVAYSLKDTYYFNNIVYSIFAMVSVVTCAFVYGFVNKDNLKSDFTKNKGAVGSQTYNVVVNVMNAFAATEILLFIFIMQNVYFG